MVLGCESGLDAGALTGMRVLDLTRILAGPTCTQLLGDLGADVIKVERPGVGDETRMWGPPFVKDADGKDTTESAYYLCANRNKRSVAIDISKPEGSSLVNRLLEHCDVLVENFKRGGLSRYGLGYEDVRAQHPRLVFCSITGFGQTGPNAHRPGYDIIAQAYGGIMSLTGEPDGVPMKVPVGIADVMCGMYAAVAILAALRHRDATGAGQHIDLSLVDSQIAWLINEGTNYLLSGETPERRGNQHPNIVPYQVFEVADGSVIVAVGNDTHFLRFCELIGEPELAGDARFATNAQRLRHREVLIPLLAERLASLTKAEVIEGLEARSVPAGPVNTLPDVFSSDQVAAREMKISVAHELAGSGTVELIGNPAILSRTPVSYRRPPPLLGEHTNDVLAQLLDMDDFALHRLRERKVI